MARRRLLSVAVRDLGETLLAPKLQMLKGGGPSGPSAALSLLTGRLLEWTPQPAPVLPSQPSIPTTKSNLQARTVYLSQDHLRDVDALIELFVARHAPSRRVTRSAVLRRAIEYLRDAVQHQDQDVKADLAKSLPIWENA